MWIVRLALRRPYTFVVMSMLIVIAGIYSIFEMPTDILPEIDIPVVAVVWQYGGLPPEEMERRFSGGFERFLTTTVDGIEHIESQSLYGVSIIKVFFHPGTKIEMANAQITANAQTALRFDPPGSTPPLIINYSASNVAILQGSIHSDTLQEQQLLDLTSNFLRVGLATVQGAQMPYPYGGKQREVMVDLDLARLHSFGLSPNDVSDALQAQNLILPSGTVKLGNQELLVRLNSSPDAVRDIGQLPIKTVNGSTVTIGDVAQVRDGYAPQTNLVLTNGRRGALLSLFKSASASTLDIVKRVRAIMPSLLATLPPEYKLDFLFDQSLFVRAAVEGVVKEAGIAAGLTALMILLFLGSWRSTLIVVISIPLSILVSIICLALPRPDPQPDDAGRACLSRSASSSTTRRSRSRTSTATWRMKKPLVRAILDGAQQIAVPAFVATLCICIVFVPVVFISGAARSLFTPLGMAVVFAMLTSYLLSRTLVPTMVQYLLGAEASISTPATDRAGRATCSGASTSGSTVHFERLRHGVRRIPRLGAGSPHARPLGVRGLRASCRSRCLPHPRPELLPRRSTRGRSASRARCPPARASRRPSSVFVAGRRQSSATSFPKDELETIIDNVGPPMSGINLSLSDASLISLGRRRDDHPLKAKHHRRPPSTCKELRRRLPLELPGATVFFLAPDITNQVLNFGLTAPHRRAGRRPDGEQRGGLRDRPEAARRDRARPRCGRRAPGAGRPSARAPARRRPDRGERAGADAAECGERRARVAELERAGRAELLAGPDQGRPVSGRGPDPPVQERLAGGAQGDAGARPRERLAADARQPGDLAPRHDAGEHHALQRPADVRRPGERPGRGSRLGLGRGRAIVAKARTNLPRGTESTCVVRSRP